MFQTRVILLLVSLVAAITIHHAISSDPQEKMQTWMTPRAFLDFIMCDGDNSGGLNETEFGWLIQNLTLPAGANRTGLPPPEQTPVLFALFVKTNKTAKGTTKQVPEIVFSDFMVGFEYLYEYAYEPLKERDARLKKEQADYAKAENLYKAYKLYNKDSQTPDMSPTEFYSFFVWTRSANPGFINITAEKYMTEGIARAFQQCDLDHSNSLDFYEIAAAVDRALLFVHF